MPKYSDEFKLEALEMLKRNRGNVNGTAKQLGIGRTALARWSEQGAAKPGSIENPEEEVRRLRRKLEQAEMEREILKKAVAFFAKEKC